MKWLMFFLILTASGIAHPARKALAFEFAQGVIVDPVRSVIYIMNPDHKIDAVNLFTGEVMATSISGAKPLLLHDDVLLAQTEEKDRAHALGVVGLMTKDLKPKFEVDLPLPNQVQASIDDRLDGSFFAGANIDGKEIVLQWRSVQYPVSGVATREPAHIITGFARIDLTSGRLIDSGEGEPSAPRIAKGGVPSNAEKRLNSGALASQLCRLDNLIAAIENVEEHPGAGIVLHRWSTDTGQRLPDIRLFGNELTFRYFSRDCRYLLASKADSGWIWSIYSVTTGDRVAEIHMPLPASQFFVFGDSVIYELPASGRLISGHLTIDQPPRLMAANLNTGEELWSRPIRDISYRGSRPPNLPNASTGQMNTGPN